MPLKPRGHTPYRIPPYLPTNRRALHHWIYRGQVLPTSREVLVQVAVVTDRNDAAHRLTANGLLLVDGRVLYKINGFTLVIDADVAAGAQKSEAGRAWQTS